MPCILLLDDDAMLRPLNARMLAQRGASVRAASGLAEAIAYAYAEHFDVAVVDLAEGGSARDAAECLLRPGALVGRVILCGGTAEDAGDRLFSLSKPFDFERLAEQIFRPAVRARASSGVYPRAEEPLSPTSLTRSFKGR